MIANVVVKKYFVCLCDKVAKKAMHFLIMALAARKIKFKIEKGMKRPKTIDEKNSIFLLYAHEKVKIKPQEFKFAYLKFSIHLPEGILSPFLIVPALRDEGLELTNYSNINSNKRIRLEVFNKTYDKTFTLKKNQRSLDLCY